MSHNSTHFLLSPLANTSLSLMSHNSTPPYACKAWGTNPFQKNQKFCPPSFSCSHAINNNTILPKFPITHFTQVGFMYHKLLVKSTLPFRDSNIRSSVQNHNNFIFPRAHMTHNDNTPFLTTSQANNLTCSPRHKQIRVLFIYLRNYYK
jgi:hypothetical protein